MYNLIGVQMPLTKLVNLSTGLEDGSSANVVPSLASAAKIPVSPGKQVMADLLQNRFLNLKASIQFKGISNYIQQAVLPYIHTMYYCTANNGRKYIVLKTMYFLPLFAHKNP